MATRNLARTVVEGGRRPYSKYACREATRIERMQLRCVLRRATVDPESIDGAVIPLRKPVRPDFSDRLNPTYRWLHAQVGRPWDAVFRELCRRFDRRSLKGWRLIDQHVVKHMVDTTESWRQRRFRFGHRGHYVDRDGILRYEDPTVRYRPPDRVESSPVSVAELKRWLADRKVGRRGSRLFWFVFTPGTHAVWRERQFYVESPGLPRYETRRVEEFVPAYRQDRPLSRDEVAFYERLPSWAQVEIAKHLADVARPQANGQRPDQFFYWWVPGASPLVTDDEAA